MANLFEGIYEPTITIFLEAGEPMEPMSVVILGTGADAGKVFLERGSKGAAKPYGFVTQKVTATGVDPSAAGGLVSRTAKVGDKVGIYVGGGILKTDRIQTGDTIAVGDVLYCGLSGTVTNTQPDDPTDAIGIAEDVDNGVVRFKSLI